MTNRNDDKHDDDNRIKRKSLRASNDNTPLFKKKSAKDMENNLGLDQGYIRLRNERLERLEQPLLASDHWRDVFSGDPTLGNPSSKLSGPWQISAFALLGVVVVLSAIFLHMVAENNSESHHTPYNSYRRRQRHARRMYKTRKKKTDEWSDDEEDLIIQKGGSTTGRLADNAAVPAGVNPPQGDDAQFYPFYYDPAAAPAAVTPGFTAQEHRQRRTSYKEPNTPPSASASGTGGRSNYYLPVNPTYKSPSANILNISAAHRRGISPGNSFSSNKSSGAKSPGPGLRATTPIGASGGLATSPSHIMRTTTPLSARNRIPTTPDGKDLFPSMHPSHSTSSGKHPTLPPPPEESQLPADDALAFGNFTLSTPRGTHELGARPLSNSNFSSFASMEGSGDEHPFRNNNISGGSNNNNNNRVRGSSQDTPLSASLHYSDLIHNTSAGTDSHNSHAALYESHQRSLMLTPGNYEAETPQIGNFRKILSPENFGTAIPNLDPRLMPPGGNNADMPFIPALEASQFNSIGSSTTGRPLLYAAARPPRSVLLDELRIVQMETGSSTHWAVQEEVSESHDDSAASFQSDEFQPNMAGSTFGIFDADSFSEEGDDIPIPSGDPRGGIKHKRDDLTKDTNAYKSLQSNIDFGDLKLEEVIGGGGFGQVWRATWYGTPVAVKVLTGSAQNQHIAKAILEEFKAEINLLKVRETYRTHDIIPEICSGIEWSYYHARVGNATSKHLPLYGSLCASSKSSHRHGVSCKWIRLGRPTIAIITSLRSRRWYSTRRVANCSLSSWSTWCTT